MMSNVGSRSRDCPSWEQLARFVAEGGPWPAEHLRTCQWCSERREFLERLALGVAAGCGHEPRHVTCPEPTEVISLVEGDVAPRERERLVDHVAECDACSALLRELISLADAEVGAWEVRERVPSFTWGQKPSALLAGILMRPPMRRVAAALVATVVLVAVYFVPFPAIDSGSDARWRGPAAGIDARIAWLEAARFPAVQWDTWDEATSYRVRVWDEQGEIRFERHVRAGDPLDTPLALETAVAGDVFLWQVDALAAGEVLASTGPGELMWERR